MPNDHEPRPDNSLQAQKNRLASKELNSKYEAIKRTRDAGIVGKTTIDYIDKDSNRASESINITAPQPDRLGRVVSSLSPEFLASAHKRGEEMTRSPVSVTAPNSPRDRSPGKGGRN